MAVGERKQSQLSLFYHSHFWTMGQISWPCTLDLVYRAVQSTILAKVVQGPTWVRDSVGLIQMYRAGQRWCRAHSGHPGPSEVA